MHKYYINFIPGVPAVVTPECPDVQSTQTVIAKYYKVNNGFVFFIGGEKTVDANVYTVRTDQVHSILLDSEHSAKEVGIPYVQESSNTARNTTVGSYDVTYRTSVALLPKNWDIKDNNIPPRTRDQIQYFIESKFDEYLSKGGDKDNATRFTEWLTGPTPYLGF